jgi:hypothetical protein
MNVSLSACGRANACQRTASSPEVSAFVGASAGSGTSTHRFARSTAVF